MAGWDHEFEIDRRDTDLFRDCMRLLRRTCARHYVEMGYYLDRPVSESRDRFVIFYNLSSTSLGIACDEFLTEMRAVSVLESEPRRKRLPLRLARDVAYNAVFTLREQMDEGYVAGASQPVQALLNDLQTSFWAWRVGNLPDAEFVEALHSFVVNLALETVEDADTSDSYPALVRKLLPIDADLDTDADLRSQLHDLGKHRNAVKHRRKRAEAGSAVRSGMDAVWHLSSKATGFYPDPVSPSIRRIVDEPQAVFRTPPMYTRSGDPRTIRS